MYSIFNSLLQQYGVSTYKVAKETGISQTTFSNWKSGRSVPKLDALQKIADYFNVSLEYLTTGKEKEGGETYYLNDETAEIAQEIFANKDLYHLLNMSKNLSPEQLHSLIELLNSFITNQ